jgi:two-component system phosphate regulon sensor histidine kinase PhoR
MKQGVLGRWMRKFFIRTFISYIVIIVLALILIYFFSQRTLIDFHMDKLKTHLIQVGRSLEPKIIDLYEAADLKEVDRLAKRLGKEIDIRLTVIQADGTVIADSEKDPGKMENHGDRPEVVQALAGGAQDSTRFSSTMGEQMLYLALPVEKQGETQLIIRLSLFLREIKLLINDLKWKFTAALLAIFLLALLIAWYFSRGISKPVKEIVTATREFADGNFDVKIFLKSKGELAEVADSFNNMVIRQKSLFDELTESQTELQAIISSMKEGLLVITHSGTISLCNESFEEIAGKSNVIGLPYWEVLRIPGFEEFVKTSFEVEESFYEDLELGDKFFMVGFNRMKQGDKVVIIFRNITGFKQLEKVKKDFVINLTHELKTPLTAIKGFMETLEEEENIKNTQYVEIIKRHTDRMNQIVSDLLILSELEENKRDVNFEPLNLEGIVENTLTIYREKIRLKKLQLEVDIEKDLPEMKGERFKLEQMFINLLDNALKYTDKGKISVVIHKINGEDRGSGRIKIQVKNTGVPIPEKSLSRIFERFYVVDKSRSRKMGGTGLGLAIVKHVVLMHKGEISVENRKEEGTVFTILLPVQLLS